MLALVSTLSSKLNDYTLPMGITATLLTASVGDICLHPKYEDRIYARYWSAMPNLAFFVMPLALLMKNCKVEEAITSKYLHMTGLTLFLTLNNVISDPIILDTFLPSMRLASPERFLISAIYRYDLKNKVQEYNNCPDEEEKQTKAREIDAFYNSTTDTKSISSIVTGAVCSSLLGAGIAHLMS